MANVRIADATRNAMMDQITTKIDAGMVSGVTGNISGDIAGEQTGGGVDLKLLKRLKKKKKSDAIAKQLIEERERQRDQAGTERISGKKKITDTPKNDKTQPPLADSETKTNAPKKPFIGPLAEQLIPEETSDFLKSAFIKEKSKQAIIDRDEEEIAILLLSM